MEEVLANRYSLRFTFRDLITYLLIFTFCLFFGFGCNGTLETFGVEVKTGSNRAEALRIIQEGLSDSEPQVRAQAIEVVADVGLLELMPKVQRLLKDDFVPVRFAAAVAVGDVEYYLAREPIRVLQRDPDENVRIAAAYALVRLGSSAEVGSLRKAVSSSDQTVRANSVWLIGKSGDKGSLDLLYWAKNSEDSELKVSFQAAEAIARLGDERIYTKLWTMLISKYVDNRIMGVKAMGTLGSREAKNALITMLDDEVLEIRLSAAEQLGMLGYSLGEAEVVDVFTQELTAGLDEMDSEKVKVLTALAIGQIGTERLVMELPGLLKDRSKFVRIAASKAVFQLQKGK
jgi:HEAT repeat protein